MATYKIVNSEQLDADLTVVADAIRAKSGTSETLSFPDGMSQAIEAITSGSSYKGEYSDNTAYVAGDVVIYGGNAYLCTSDTTAGYNPVDWALYWNGGTPLNDVNSGGNTDEDSTALSLVTLSAGTYTFASTMYNANYLVHPYRYDITELVSGTYTADSSGGMYERIKLSGCGGQNCPDAPETTIAFLDSSGNTVASFGASSLVSADASITISSDTQVSSLFYSVLMGMMG